MTKFKFSTTKIPVLYFIFVVLVLGTWLTYVLNNQLGFIFEKHWAAMLTMLFGSFIAGSSPEGSAAIAYPVFTLILKIDPAVARNFAFAIQSIGMSSASLLILGLKIKVDWHYIKYVTFGGIFGLIFGTYYIVPLISPPLAKLFFVSLWLSFGLILWIENRKPNRKVVDFIQNFNRRDVFLLIVFGLIGGVISAIFGTGINIFTFCLMTIFYRINEKVAVPSSVIIMTLETLLGFFLHAGLIRDFQQSAFEMWLACIPVVIFFAPLGSFVISKVPRTVIAKFLYIILIVQFFGAIWVLRPSYTYIGFCVLTILTGLTLFGYIAKQKKN